MKNKIMLKELKKLLPHLENIDSFLDDNDLDSEGQRRMNRLKIAISSAQFWNEAMIQHLEKNHEIQYYSTNQKRSF